MIQVLTALLLGLLTILDPCTLVTSITAISYIDKEINNKRKVLGNGAMFVLGKLATYVLLSIPFLAGAQTEGIKHMLGHFGEPILAGFMLICGVVLLFSGHHHHEHDHGVSKFLQNADSNASWLWSFILGIPTWGCTDTHPLLIRSRMSLLWASLRIRMSVSTGVSL